MDYKPVRDAERVSEVVKPNPYAGLPSGPYAHIKTSPYDHITTNPYAHLRPVDPYAGLTATPTAETANPNPRLGNAYQRALAKAARPRKTLQTARHHLILPPFGLPPLRPIWSLPLSVITDAYEHCGPVAPLEPGWGVDFTDVGQALAGLQDCCGDCDTRDAEFEYHLDRIIAERGIDVNNGDGYEQAIEDAWDQVLTHHLHPAWANRIAPGTRAYTGWDEETLRDGSYETTGGDWQQVLRLWGLAREQILADPQAVLRGSGEINAHRALVAAGYDFAEGFYTGTTLAAMILDHLDTDVSLRAAFPDQVIHTKLDLYPHFGNTDAGPDITFLREAIAELGDEAGVMDIGASQLLVFDQLRPALETYDDPRNLHGRYVATRAVYHSLIDESDDQAPEGMVGWRELRMVPCDADWEPTDW